MTGRCSSCTGSWSVGMLLVLGGVILSPVISGFEARAADGEEYRVQIFVGNADGSELKRLVVIPEYQSHGSPCWSQDGQKIAFDAWKSQNGEQFSDGHLILVNSDGTDWRDLGSGIMPSLSPKGNRVAYMRHSSMGDKGVWMADVNDLESKIQIDRHGWGVDWSPDGTRIAYAGGGNLFVYSVIEGTVEPLFDLGSPTYKQIFWNFSWSPDSSRIAFKAMTKENQPVLATVDARGESFGGEILYAGTIHPTVTWHPSGKEILMSMPDPGSRQYPRLFRVDVANKTAPVVLPNQPPDRMIDDPSYSPDGKRLAVRIFQQ